MEKTLDILVASMVALAGLQIAVAHYLTRGFSYIELLQSVDFSALQTAFSLIPFLF